MPIPRPEPVADPVDMREKLIDRVISTDENAKKAIPKKKGEEAKKLSYTQDIPDDIVHAINLGNFRNIRVQIGIQGKPFRDYDGDQKQELLAALHNPVRRCDAEIKTAGNQISAAEEAREEFLAEVDIEKPTKAKRRALLLALDGDKNANPPVDSDYKGFKEKAVAILPENMVVPDVEPKR